MNFAKVNGYPYVIHPCGTILKIWNGWTKEKKPSKTKEGYMVINLYNNGKRKTFKVHRLLALHFIPNPENKPHVDHINGIRDDNRLENLRWVTHKENMNGFRSDRGVYAKITKGHIGKKNKNSWIWYYYMSGKQKYKNMKSKEALEKFRDETLKKFDEKINP
tara:strand:+ start:40 stop:525 length:486 start_codon:yes stop_codon:yes gene_type:complete